MAEPSDHDDRAAQILPQFLDAVLLDRTEGRQCRHARKIPKSRFRVQRISFGALPRMFTAEDLRTLKAMRRRPLKFRRLDDFLKSDSPDA